MALSMLGMLVITPWLASILEPVFSFVWKFLHIDPSIVPAILFASDMGVHHVRQRLLSMSKWEDLTL